MKGRWRGGGAWCLVTAVLSLLAVVVPGDVEAQRVSGRLTDADNGAPVAMAGVFILDAERDVLVGSSTDSIGYYVIEPPGPGEYILFVQRIGYFENESPLFRAEAEERYSVSFEMRPEPFRIDPLDVTVRNEELEDFLSLELGVNPNSVFGYRAYQGARVQQAKLDAEDNTDFLRELYIPVSHGIQVCVGRMGRSHPDRSTRQASQVRRCGQLSVDGMRVPNEHIESIDLDRIAVVVTFPGEVRLYTREFDWSFRPGRPPGAEGRGSGGVR